MMRRMTIADEHAAQTTAQCWCCDNEYADADLVRLGAHPEVGICSGCAQFLHRRAVEHDDASRRSPGGLLRSGVRAGRDWVIAHGWHEKGKLGAVLRRLDRHLP